MKFGKCIFWKSKRKFSQNLTVNEISRDFDCGFYYILGFAFEKLIIWKLLNRS